MWSPRPIDPPFACQACRNAAEDEGPYWIGPGIRTDTLGPQGFVSGRFTLCARCVRLACDETGSPWKGLIEAGKSGHAEVERLQEENERLRNRVEALKAHGGTPKATVDTILRELDRRGYEVREKEPA